MLRPLLPSLWIAAAIGLAACDVRAQTTRYVVEGAVNGHEFARSLCVLGDIDGDLRPDFAVGSPGFDAPGASDSGRVTLYSGVDGRLLHSIDGLRAVDRFGGALASLGDVDGDGAADLAVGAVGHDGAAGANSGAVTVFSGADGRVLLQVEGTAAFASFGAAIAAPGDVDGDGWLDLAVGAPRHGAGGVDAGRVAIYSGFDGAELHSWLGTPGDQLGHALAAYDDADGDRITDLVIGVPFADDLAIDAGAVEVVSLGTGAVLARIGGVTSQGFFGYSLAAGGDVDGDGIRDFLVGAPFDDAVAGPFRFATGAVFVYSGAVGLPEVPLRATSGVFSGEQFGWAIADAGDVDADGIRDHVVGSPGHSVGVSGRGRASVRSGATGAELFGVLGVSRGDAMGTAVSGGLDIDEDGHSEVIVGGPWIDVVSGNDRGQAIIAGTDAVSPQRPSVTTFGRICPGSSGALPRLALRGVPVLGMVIGFELASAPPGVPAVLSIDSRRAEVLLDPLGAIGCTLVTGSVIGRSVTVDPRGWASTWMRVPAQPSLAGTKTYAQWVILDPAANSLGVITSNAARIGIGRP